MIKQTGSAASRVKGERDMVNFWLVPAALVAGVVIGAVFFPRRITEVKTVFKTGYDKQQSG